MGMEVQTELGPDRSVEMVTAIRRGLVEAGTLILAASDAQAPRDDTPVRHGYHMTETGFVHALPGIGDDETVAIGYSAFWAVWQHEHMDWHHTHGQAKFLELAVIEMEQPALAVIAETVRAAFA